jgi:alkylated DNA nucleotide flippase Atl1
MPSIRAEAVAEVLWELKQLEKLSTYTEVAERAGFKPGVNGKTILTCLETVRKEWPHLQWWRAVQEDGRLKAESEHAGVLQANGYELSPVTGRAAVVEIVAFETHVYSWTLTADDPATVEA